jgi:hypothetical protein
MGMETNPLETSREEGLYLSIRFVSLSAALLAACGDTFRAPSSALESLSPKSRRACGEHLARSGARETALTLKAVAS